MVSVGGSIEIAPVSRSAGGGFFIFKGGFAMKKVFLLSILFLFFTSMAFADPIIIQRTGTETSEICFNNFDCEFMFRYYCAKPSGDCVGEGVCTLAPECSTCPYYYYPVCGCDGMTYAGDCWAECMGVSVAYSGPCISKCLTWDDVIEKYWDYKNGQAAWNDVITCYNQYASK